VGSTPVEFRNARVVPPVPSHEVAELLRQHDVYVMASRNESCSNALLEALACGLPSAYLRSGSNAELVGEAGVGFDADEGVIEAVEAVADQLCDLRERIVVPSLAEVADRYLEVFGLSAASPPRYGGAADG
jgi:glycosyltransferase involved in cell wall biosynthesis